LRLRIEWENFTGSISYMPLTLSTQKLLNVFGQIVTYKGLKINYMKQVRV
jgi:hypothetical protein